MADTGVCFLLPGNVESFSLDNIPAAWVCVGVRPSNSINSCSQLSAVIIEKEEKKALQ